MDSVQEGPPRPRGERRFYDRELAGVYRRTVDGRMVDCNLALATLLGFSSREELLESTALSPCTGGNAALARLRRTGAVTGEETCLRRRDGRPVQVVYSERLAPQPAGGELVEGALIDVTAHQGDHADDQLLGALARGVSHRAASPLAAIVANLGFALELVSHAAREDALRADAAFELGQALRDARAGADSLRALLGDLALFSRPTAAGERLADLARALRSALALVEFELRGCASVELAIDESLPVGANEPLLGRCLLRLLLDALAAMAAAGGEQRLRIATRREGELVIAELEDSAARPDPDDGSGLLGCHVLVAAMGGELSIAPAGRGRRARLALPRV